MIGVAILFAIAVCACIASMYFTYRLRKRIFETYNPLLARGIRGIQRLEEAIDLLNETRTEVKHRKVLYEELLKAHENKLKELDTERENILNCTDSYHCSITVNSGEAMYKAKKRLASKLGYALINEFPLLEEMSSLSINVPVLNVKKAFGDAVEECDARGESME